MKYKLKWIRQKHGELYVLVGPTGTTGAIALDCKLHFSIYRIDTVKQNLSCILKDKQVNYNFTTGFYLDRESRDIGDIESFLDQYPALRQDLNMIIFKAMLEWSI